MYHRFDIAVNKTTGVPIPGTIVRVYDQSGAQVSLFADTNGTPIESVSGIANAAVADDAGNYSYYVGDGIYSERIYSGDVLVLTIPNLTLKSGTDVDPNLSSIKNASIDNISRIYNGYVYHWTAGDYTGQADDDTVISSNVADISTGAWIKQSLAPTDLEASTGAGKVGASDGNTVQENLDHGGYNDDPIFPAAAYLKTTSDIVNSEEVNLLRGVPKSEWAAIAAGTSNYDCAASIASIMADMDSKGVKGGTLLIPRGKFLVTSPVETGYRASIRGVGSRSSVITVPDGALDADFPDGVILLKNQIDATPFLFSVSLRDVQIAANGLAKGVTVYGGQENTIIDNIVISQFVSQGLVIPQFAQTTHGSTFSNLHIIPLGGSTAAIGIYASYVQKCLFSNITTGIDQSVGDGYYAHGIKLDGNCVENLFQLIHNESADVGIEEIGGGLNRYLQIEGNRPSGGPSSVHFKSNNSTHVIEGIRTISNITNQYQSAAYTIAATADMQTRRIAPNASGLEYVNSAGSRIILGAVTSDATAVGAADLRKGIQLYRGAAGNGRSYLTQQISIPASSSVFVEIDTGNSATTGFAGTLCLDFHTTGTVRFNTKAAFAGAVTSAGAMSNGQISSQFGGTNLTKLTISAPAALTTATAGKFHIGITNTTAESLSGEVSVEITQSAGFCQSISVQSS